MENIERLNFDSKEKFYNYLNIKLTGLVCTEEDWLANLCNASALLFALMEDINWSGFYLYKNNELVLGPFQGKPACTHIEMGKGVCGTSAETKCTQLVRNVHEFPGHIACDSNSNSEIVVPMISEGRLVGVLDIDSPVLSRFDEVDLKYLEKFVSILIRYIKFPSEFI